MPFVVDRPLAWRLDSGSLGTWVVEFGSPDDHAHIRVLMTERGKVHSLDDMDWSGKPVRGKRVLVDGDVDFHRPDDDEAWFEFHGETDQQIWSGQPARRRSFSTEAANVHYEWEDVSTVIDGGVGVLFTLRCIDSITDDDRKKFDAVVSSFRTDW